SRKAPKTARTRIHRSSQHEASRKRNDCAGTADCDAAVLDRLTQQLQNISRKFRKFVEKKHPSMGQAHFAWLWDSACSSHTATGHGMMRIAKGTFANQSCPLTDQSGGAVYFRYL